MGIFEEVKEYVRCRKYRVAMGLPETVIEDYTPLAQGEYNVNYAFVHPLTKRKLVLRVNCGSQMHLDNQIEYEANALNLLSKSGRTPAVYYVDGSKEAPGNGVLVMDYIPGDSLDYRMEEHLAGAAECLADIHSVSMPADHGLVEPANSLKAIADECEEMLAVYLESNLSTQSKKDRLRKLLDEACTLIPEGADTNSYKCCINTELNSTNFLVEDGTVRLVDWEKPLYGDPAQDLGHFLAPTTSFWKTDIIFDSDIIESFIRQYIEAVDGRFDTFGIRERTLAFITITCLRGMTWCAMAWVQYQGEDKTITNDSTWHKLNQYLSEDFIALVESEVHKAME